MMSEIAACSNRTISGAVASEDDRRLRGPPLPPTDSYRMVRPSAVRGAPSDPRNKSAFPVPSEDDGISSLVND